MGTCGLGDPGGNPDLRGVVVDGETEAEVRKFDGNRTGKYRVHEEPSKDWGLICGIVLAMLGLVGMLVFLVNTK